MSRSYDPSTLIALPRLDARGWDALVKHLVAVATRAGMLPKAIASALKRLDDKHGSLAEALLVRLAAMAAPTPAVRAADLAEDAAWSALFDWLTGFAKLPFSPPEAAVAAAILAVLFPDGLKFTKIAYRLEWSEVETRIKLIAEQKLDEQIEGLGGGVFLRTVARAHKEYGEALGITRPLDPAAAAALRTPLEDMIEALRLYVLRVAAHADPDDPETQALVDKLLAPLVEAESRANNASTAASDAGKADKDGSPGPVTPPGTASGG